MLHPSLTAAVRAIECHLPEGRLTNEELAQAGSPWDAAAILEKTGIAQRRIAAPEECASDLAYEAARKLFASGACQPADIDYLLLCTQSPDFLLPTTACLLQDRLGLRKEIGALDFNLGCSGFVYGLGLAKGLIETGQARRVLLLTAETYSKLMAEDDFQVRTIFGDAAAATLISAAETSTAYDAAQPTELIGPFVYGTDGSGGMHLAVEGAGARQCVSAVARGLGLQASRGTSTSEEPLSARLTMNGPEIFAFTLKAVPQAVSALLAKSQRTLPDVQLFLFHQANKFMLERLRAKIGIPADRFPGLLEECGNTVSSTLPLLLKHCQETGRLHRGDTVMLVGFGVGLSWGATLLRWLP